MEPAQARLIFDEAFWVAWHLLVATTIWLVPLLIGWYLLWHFFLSQIDAIRGILGLPKLNPKVIRPRTKLEARLSFQREMRRSQEEKERLERERKRTAKEQANASSSAVSSVSSASAGKSRKRT